MGAHSSLTITQADAKEIWTQVVKGNGEATFEEMEAFFDKALDNALYNVCIYEQLSEGVTSDAGTVRRYVAEYLEANPTKRPQTPTSENWLLRQMLALRVGGPHLYTDDGELQDNSEHPAIDFKRDSAELIRQKLIQRAERKLGTLRGIIG